MRMMKGSGFIERKGFRQVGKSENGLVPGVIPLLYDDYTVHYYRIHFEQGVHRR